MKTGPFYFLQAQAGGNMAEGAWGSAKGYTDARTEHFAVREKVGLIDFSSMGNLDIKGRDAKDALQRICVNDMDKLTVGKVLYTTVVNAEGGILDDTTVYMLADGHYMMVTSTAKRFATLKYLLDHARGKDVFVTDITGGTGIMCLQGPASVGLINSIADSPIDELKYFFFKKLKIAGNEVLVSRTGFTGSRGYELFVSGEDCFEVWKAVLGAGGEFGLQLCGSQVAAATLPLEKGYLSGRELTESSNPFELGLGWTVALDKAVPCVANDALKKIKERGPANRLVGFVMPDKAMTVANGTPVTSGGAEIGRVTSAAFGWYLDRFIGMAYIRSEYAALGGSITVASAGGPVDVEIVDKVFFDPERKQL
ncbi:MAG: aminomethyltransferase family protein [Clostridiales Family XIII bacterium]|jgi:aminomethyltransferase|nr:aminomethyltransferase family protein [Clostridiales Family XIII bacterium]